MISTLWSQEVNHQSQNNRSAKCGLDQSEEAFWLQKIAQGDRQVFWQLWLKYKDYLFHCCQKWTEGNSVDAEEILSQACLKAWEKLPQYAHKIKNIKGWLARMTHNLCVDIYRAKKRGVQNTELIDQIPESANMLTNNSHSSDFTSSHSELISYLRQGINNLPARLKEPLILLYYYQMSYEEIAQRLLISKDNVYKRISQARIMLEKHLQNKTSVDHQPQPIKVKIEKQNCSAHRQNQIRSTRQIFNGQWEVEKLPNNSHNSLLKEQAFTDSLEPIVSPEFTEIISYQVTALCLD